jgi:HPt (histidine-containing phosphotransfer) domain-containing protein
MDLDAALGRLGGQRSLLSDMIQFYLEDAPDLLAQLEQGVKGGDAALIERAAHSLKGLSATFSAERAVTATAAVEAMGRTKELSNLAPAHESVKTEIAALVKALEAHRAGA